LYTQEKPIRDGGSRFYSEHPTLQRSEVWPFQGNRIQTNTLLGHTHKHTHKLMHTQTQKHTNTLTRECTCTRTRLYTQFTFPCCSMLKVRLKTKTLCVSYA